MKKYSKVLIITLLLFITCIGLTAVSATNIDANPTETVGFPDIAGSTDNIVLDTSNAIDESNLNTYTIEDSNSKSDSNDALTTSEKIVLDADIDEDGTYVAKNGSDTNGNGSYSNPYATIQTAIDASKNGTSVYIGSGSYNITSPISINKRITITSYDGEVILNGKGTNQIFTIGTSASPTLKGLSIINGYGTKGGVADLSNFDKSNNTFIITNCSFINNTASNGGVFYITTTQTATGNTEIYISNSTFINNTASEKGGVFYSVSSNSGTHTVTSSLFLNNYATAGGALYFSGMLNFNVQYCVLINNTNNPYHSAVGRSGYTIKDSYWGTNDPSSLLNDIGGVELVSYVKIAIVNDYDTITSSETATITVKYTNNNNDEYGPNIFIPAISGNITSLNGTLSVKSGNISVSALNSIFTPSKIGIATITVRALGGQSVSTNINVTPEPIYAGPNAVDGRGNGSLSNPYSLNDAINLVNTNNDPIAVIELLNGNYISSKALNIKANLTVRPYKTANITISGNNSHTIFIISENIEVLIANLTLVNGSSTNGGAIYLSKDSNLTIISSIISNNSANYGGGIYAENNSYLDISHSQISNNKELSHSENTAYGCGIYNLANATIIANNNWWGKNSNPLNSSLTSNYKAFTADTWLVVNLSNSKEVLRDTWTDDINIQLLVYNSTNTSYSPIGSGGVVKPILARFSTNTGNLSITNGYLNENNSYSINSTISKISKNATVTVKVDNQTFTLSYTFEIPMTEIYVATTGDDASGNGTQTNPFRTIERGLAIAKEAGATIYVAKGSYDDANNLYIANRNLTISSYNGDALIDRTNYFNSIYVASGANLTIDKLIFVNGYDNTYASVAITNYGNLTIKNSSFTNATGAGFGEFVSNMGHAEIYDSNFTNNKIYSIYSTNAAIFNSGTNAYAYIYNCRFTNNGFVNTENHSNNTSGGITTNTGNSETAFRNNGGVLLADNCYFTDNYGSVSMVYQNGNTTIQNSIIENNQKSVALNTASGVEIIMNVINCTFTNNTAGAIGIARPEFTQENALTVVNCRFINNNAINGGAIYTKLAASTIENCTFINNTATNGGAIYNIYCAMDVIDCTFINNSATERGGSIFTNGTSENVNILENNITNSHAAIGGAIYSNGLTLLEDNRMTNCSADEGSYIYNDNRVGPTYIFVLNNQTITVNQYTTYSITAKVTDDMGNLISGAKVNLTIGGKEYYGTSVQGIGTVKYTFDKTGTFKIGGNYTGSRRYDTRAANATIIVKAASSTAATINVTHTGNDNYDIQKAIDSAKPGDVINLGSNYNYKNIDFINVTKSLSFKGSNVSISSADDADCIFHIIPKSGKNNYAVISEGADKVVFTNINFNTKDNDILVYAIAEDNGYASNIAEISITKLNVNASGASNVTVLKVSSDSKVFNPTSSIVVSENTLTTGIKPFVLENTYWKNESDIIIPTADKIATTLTVEDVSTKDNTITASLKDINGDILTNKTITYAINGSKYNKTTNSNGQIIISNLTDDVLIDFVFAGDDSYDASYTSVKYSKTIKEKLSKFVFSNMTTQAIYIDRTGEYFIAKLTDENGAGIANKIVQIGFNGASYTRTTDENGSFRLQVNLKIAGGYTFAICFLGDNTYNSSFAVAKITVNRATTKLTNVKSKYTYKSSAKTKSIAATLKLSNGTVISGKTVKFTVNGKTYSATTNSKGVATVKVSITAKKTYKYTVKFAATNQLAAASTTGTLVIN